MLYWRATVQPINWNPNIVTDNFLTAIFCDGTMYADQIEGLKDLVAPSVSVLASHHTLATVAKLILLAPLIRQALSVES